jgi:predicted phage tail protein
MLAEAAVEAGTQPFQFTIDAWTVQIVGTLIIPVIVGVLVKAKASPWLKSLVNLVLVAVSTLIAANVNEAGAAVLSKETLIVFAVGLTVSVMTYLGVYQNLPTPAGKENGINNLLAPRFGIGKEQPAYIETTTKAGPA